MTKEPTVADKLLFCSAQMKAAQDALDAASTTKNFGSSRKELVVLHLALSANELLDYVVDLLEHGPDDNQGKDA